MSIFKYLFDSAPVVDNLRIIITRHGERADLRYGEEWMSLIPGNGVNSRISYLTPRSIYSEWDIDPPLTTHGERQGFFTGRKLLQLRFPIDHCFSSPAYRSIQTANKILEGQGRRNIPINIEPGLFECPLWYAGEYAFIPPMLLARDRYFNINPYYRPAFNKVDTNEDETGYYQRSRILIDAITNAYKNRGGTILLSGHAGSIEALTRGMLQRHARPESLRFYADRVNYCNFAILDRDARSGEWSVHLPVTNENPYGGQRILHTSVPLYSASSQYILKDHIPGRRSLYGTNPYGNKSFHY